jgi:hypothetical protein
MSRVFFYLCIYAQLFDLIQFFDSMICYFKHICTIMTWCHTFLWCFSTKALYSSSFFLSFLEILLWTIFLFLGSKFFLYWAEVCSLFSYTLNIFFTKQVSLLCILPYLLNYLSSHYQHLSRQLVNHLAKIFFYFTRNSETTRRCRSLGYQELEEKDSWFYFTCEWHISIHVLDEF